MLAYLYLFLTICSELVGTSMLKASAGFTKLYPTIGIFVSYFFAFFFLSQTLKTIPLNAAYAIWAGMGTIATVVISVMIWKERINAASIIGIALITIGVVVLNLFGPSGEGAVKVSNEEPVVQHLK
ncbi:multidrug efflux SMR transporter [Bacillus sp. FJAT-29814]|uniref:DMT family transporter n=1 Tax=Bacillus sp. FJAT-29814 TaxID=1729688 RepID=UPI0009E7ADB1|nr:multidrug efflux SMR transporter [Bacillus sp. FJAT-29814]